MRITPVTNKNRGLSRINPETGQKHMYAITTHDRSVRGGEGGSIVGVIGGHSSGKTTFFLQLAEYVKHIKSDSKDKWNFYTDFKNAKFDNFEPETVFWRSTESDNWTALLPQFLDKSFPNLWYKKPVRVFLHVDDPRVISIIDYDDSKNFDIDIYRFTSSEDIWDNHLVGGINVYYEPYEYGLSEKMLHMYSEKAAIPLEKLEKIKKDKIYSKVFTFDLIYTIKDLKPIKYYVSFFVDECQDVFILNANKPYFYFIEIFDVIEHQLRKDRISLYIANQEISKIHWVLVGRLMYWVFLSGVSSVHKASRLNESLVQNLNLAEKKLRDLPSGHRALLIEKQGSSFGRESFPMFKHQPDPVMLRHPRDKARYYAEVPVTNGEKA